MSTHVVHVRINDAATGKPTAARVRFTSQSDAYFPPLGRLAEFATGWNEDVGGNLQLGSEKFAYCDGSFEIALPSEPVRVEVSKGFEYEPLRQQVSLGPGKLALRFSMERWTDSRVEGWYSGDTRAHFLTPHAALLEAAAEDLAVVNLLATPCQIARGKQPDPESEAESVWAIPNLLAFSGQKPALEMPGHMVVVNTHNQHSTLGGLGLLNCHRVVYPLRFGGPGGWDNWTLADWCDQCHRKGGLVIWTQMVTPLEETNIAYGEQLADLILGKVDALETDGFESPEPVVVRQWYHLLNSGLRVPLVGGSGKESNQEALGSVRTYARLQSGEQLSYQSWIEAVRVGRTFVTNGPLLTLKVHGQDPGAVLVVAPTETIRVRAEARALAPFERLELVVNGDVAARADATEFPSSCAMELELPAGTGGWLAARCWGNLQGSGDLYRQCVYAHTSPVYVRVADVPAPVDPISVRLLHSHLGTMLRWVQREGRFENDEQRQRLAGVFEGAKDKLVGKIEHRGGK